MAVLALAGDWNITSASARPGLIAAAKVCPDLSTDAHVEKQVASMRCLTNYARGVRGLARYRTETAHALLGKALIEAAGTASSRTRIMGQRERQSDGVR